MAGGGCWSGGCGSTSQYLVRYLAHGLSVKAEGKIPISHALYKPERGSSDEKTGTDFRTEASGLRQDKYDVPNPPSSAVRWAVIRMGIVRRPRKAQATGVVTRTDYPEMGLS